MFSFIAGFSLLQGGPLPNFLAEDQIHRIFAKGDSANLKRDESDFRNGLENFGLIEVGFPSYQT